MSLFKSTQFWERYCSSDPEALSKYASIVVPIVTKAATKSGCVEHDAEVLECTLTKTHRYFCPVKIDLNDNPEGFIWFMARSCAENARKQKPKTLSTDPQADDIAARDKDAPGFASEARDNQHEEDLRRISLTDCFESLSENHQTAVAFVIEFLVARGISAFQKRLPWSEMAQELNMPLQTLKDRYKRGMEELKKCMLKRHPNEPSR